MQNRVAGDLGNRFDLLLPVPPNPVAVIPDKIQDRIAFFSKSLFATSAQLDYSITTIRAQSIYPIPAGMQNLTGIRFMLGSIWLPLVRMPYEHILAVDVINPPFMTIPSVFAQRGTTFRLFATPDKNYPLELQDNLSPPPPINPTDRNFWTDDGPNGAAILIAAAACAEILRRPLNDPVKAEQFEAIRQREEASLQEYTTRLEGPMVLQGYM